MKVENGIMINKVSRLNGTLGIWNVGNPPDTLARSPTDFVSKPKLIANTETMIMDASGAGINLPTLGNFGSNTIDY